MGSKAFLVKRLVSRRRLNNKVSLFTRLSCSFCIIVCRNLSNRGRKRENARLLSWHKDGSFLVRRKLWTMVLLPVFLTSYGTFVQPEGYIHSWKSGLFGADRLHSVLSCNVLFNVFKKIVIWRKVWGVGTDRSSNNYACINVKPEWGDPGHMWGIWLFTRIFGQNPYRGAQKFGQIRSNIPTLDIKYLLVPFIFKSHIDSATML